MLRLSRRQLLKTTAISTALAATPQSVLAASREKLTIPPLIEAKRDGRGRKGRRRGTSWCR